VYSYWFTEYALAGVLLKKNGRAKIAVSRAHRWDLYEDRMPGGYLPARRQILSGTDRIFCISGHGADYLGDRFPGYRDKIRVSRLGVPAARVRNTAKKDERLYLVSCAYLSSVKRVHLLVAALAMVDLSVKWTHLGGGEQEGAIRDQAAGLPANIQWRITGLLPNQAVLEYYRENPVDLFVNMSKSEGLPVSIMEALSYGIPVAATDVGGVRELVFPGENGFLWPSDLSSETIAETIISFHQMSSRQIYAMREAAWKCWHDTVNADVRYPDFAHQLSGLLKP